MKIIKAKKKQKIIKVNFSKNIKTNIFDGKVFYIKVPKEKLDSFATRKFLRSIVRQAIQYKMDDFLFSFDEFKKSVKFTKEMSDKDLADAIGYEFVLSAYEFKKYKQKPKDDYLGIKNLFIEIDTTLFNVLKKSSEMAEIVNRARDVINTPAKDMTSLDFVRLAKKEIKTIKKTSLKILGKKEIQKEKMGAYLAVAQASNTEPKLLILNYNGGSKSEKPIVFVGKGVMYDTGGLGLKPAEFMTDMHMDMAGATVALYTFVALAKRGVKKNIIAVIPTAENAIGSKAYRNGDIVKAKDGTFIEIGHTDAEGRLLLADALVYAQEKFKPEKIIDIATLTGAAMVALGQHSSAIFAKNENDYTDLIQKSEQAGVRVWPMPLFPEYSEDIKSKVADITNSATTRYGGAITAAAFLKHFIKNKQSWVHIDIAPRMTSVSQDTLAFGATGEPISLLVKVFEK